MPANKMPEAAGRMVTFANKRMESEYAYTADQMRAMYLAGIADAKACVPERRNDALGCAAIDWNFCRATTLTNLSALEQGVGK